MASNEMAKVEYADAIKTVSGALTKIDKKSPHAGDQKMVLATHRVAPTTNPNCSRIYFRGLSSISRTSAPSESELFVRNRFKAVSRAVNTRMHDLTKIAADQAAFKAQKDLPGGKQTMKSYLWSLEKAAWEQAQNG